MVDRLCTNPSSICRYYPARQFHFDSSHSSAYRGRRPGENWGSPGLPAALVIGGGPAAGALDVSRRYPAEMPPVGVSAFRSSYDGKTPGGSPLPLVRAAGDGITTGASQARIKFARRRPCIANAFPLRPHRSGLPALPPTSGRGLSPWPHRPALRRSTTLPRSMLSINGLRPRSRGA